MNSLQSPLLYQASSLSSPAAYDSYSSLSLSTGEKEETTPFVERFDFHFTIEMNGVCDAPTSTPRPVSSTVRFILLLSLSPISL